MRNSTAISVPRPAPVSPGADPRAIVIGAGIGGLAAALTLASRGIEVTVVERSETVGGKLRQAMVEGTAIDCGPTVFTLREVFDDIFADAGATLDEHLKLVPASVLARHAWAGDGASLDLHADVECSAEAIGRFAGPAEARGYRAFCEQARATFRLLDEPFIRSPRPDMMRLVRAAMREGGAFDMAPFTTLWRLLGTHFRDPRLRQLFGRYATYCGASPFACPATLMLVAHVEQSGVWLVEGGMHRLATAMAEVARSLGVAFRRGVEVREVRVERGRAAGVDLATGERLEAEAVVCNADVAALAAGLLGEGAAAAVPRPSARSLSAVTFALRATGRGVPLLRHNVFFSDDYAAEFDDIFKRGRPPTNPTVYVCAQDRDETRSSRRESGAEPLFCIVNAPARGDTHPLDAAEIAACEASTFRTLERCGLTFDRRRDSMQVTTPSDFHRAYPATGGALYGAASHGWMASFRRPGVRSRLPGLYLCGGSTHPGPGLPMAALSGRMAATSLIEDWASMRRSRPMAMLGGMSTA